MFANCQLMGMDLAFPDVCKTPPAALMPLPYPNMALGPMAVPNAWNILFMAAPAHNMATITPITLGDIPGAAGGIISQTFMSQSRHITGAFTCIVRGTPVTRITSLALQNRCNALGMRIVPSQFKLLVLAP
ncbi:type VI secretion protein [Bordetella genomosp. 1]|uniref:Type VI secretion protein n=1 Tax=Bordetella genomosp. 1 TaxID=1395607 RepID=A0A261SES5_9BORD|nr:DUF4150 domain-containing protein [Bordetella genomosp. 1]MDQ8033587.1 DUF4150 domain-containing protein [Bordetella sp.]OZI35310.1 type VI secretion protein [Bordetella genomosp. 1]OZI63850.1 type VI secretion protein [Bordetella genomosp. 1]